MVDAAPAALDATRSEVEQLRATAQAHGLAAVVAECDAILAGVAPMAVVVRLQCAIEVQRRQTLRQATYNEAMARS